MRLALFDLDHTLLPLDSDYNWADFLARHGKAGDPQQAIAKNEALMQAYNEGRLNMTQSAEFMLGLLASHEPDALAEWHETYMQQVIRPNIKPSALKLVKQHLHAGDLCAIVTATNTFVASPIARAFGIPHFLGTDPEYINGRYTGKISGTPCFQGGKVTRVLKWLADQNLSFDDFTASYFYSDSSNDLPLLEVVSHPVATNPSDSLRAIAINRQWSIIDLFA